MMLKSQSQLPKLLLSRERIVGLALAALLCGGLSTAQAQRPEGNQGPPKFVDVLIGFDKTPGPEQRQLVRGHGGKVNRSFWLVPAVAASVPEHAVNALANARGVTVVEVDGQFQAIDDPGQLSSMDAHYASELSYGWGVEHIGAGPLHTGDVMGWGTKVAIIDSGISEHVDLYIAGGCNFVANNAIYADDNGHGTHVAGTVAAIRNGFGVVGVAPAVELYALKVLNRNGSGSFSNIIAALEWCVEYEIQVTNNSYGSGTNPGTIVQAAFDNAYAAGIVHVAAAGNSGNPGGNSDSVQWPARYATVIAVAATNQNDARASFSSSGPDLELSAPGVGIFSTHADTGQWVQMSGTSMASPHVAGVAALLVAEGVVDDPDLVRFILGVTAKPLGAANRFGAGLVQAYDAVLFSKSDPPEGPDDPPQDPDDPPVEPPGKGNGRGKK